MSGCNLGHGTQSKTSRVNLEVSVTWGPDGYGQSNWVWLRKQARVLGAVPGEGALGPSRGSGEGEGGTHGLATWGEADGQMRRHLTSGRGKPQLDSCALRGRNLVFSGGRPRARDC